MLRPDLNEISDIALPERYTVIKNTDDMLSDWVALLNAVFGGYTINRVRDQVDSPRWSPDRVKLVQQDGTLIALSVAWHEEALWPKSGHVIWVAVLPKHQGKGLGSYLSAKR